MKNSDNILLRDLSKDEFTKKKEKIISKNNINISKILIYNCEITNDNFLRISNLVKN